MGRITIKGGVWKNTEDEILKAAVMKYGLNQWSRISSLLVRKSARQCKARWYEWLDPSIRKTEWSRAEEERLLHLAKIMPCQWRTIAPMMGRTAAQCLERYEQLLDAAQQPEEAAAAAASSKPGTAARMEDPRRLRPGEIDPLPEAKPARPDPQDMDEDELEQLSEARARLANTKGKKAKRKAREKQLEESRRLAVLQKEREMRAAGIEPRQQKKRKAEIDYNEEVPFERKAPAGFYSVAEEDAELAAAKASRAFKVRDLQDVEGKSRDAIEAEERKKDAKRLKLFKEANLPEALLKINQLNDPQQISRRLDMNLPAPQVSEQELHEIAKLGGGNLAAVLAGGATPMRPGATPLPTRTPMRPDTILRESQNLLALTKANSSLLGGENAPLQESDFSGITPRSTAVATPNALATPSRMSGMTPARGLTPGATPLRDGLGINAAGGLSAEQALMAASRARSRRAGPSKLSSSLKSLPQPQNQFALVLPDLPAEPDSDATMEEDAEEALARAHVAQQEQREAEWRAESQVIQRGLPRPLVVNLAPMEHDDAEDEVQKQLQSEMLALVRYDAAKYPVEQPGKKNGKRAKLPQLERFSEEELSAARKLVEAEMQSTHKLSDNEIKAVLSQLDLSVWDATFSDTLFLPSTRQFGLASEADPESLLEAYKQQFELVRSACAQHTKKADRLERNLSVQVGGYQQINAKLRTEVNQLHTQIVDAQRNQSCFTMLANQEAYAIPYRKHQMQQAYWEQQEKERELQAKFQKLSQQAAEMNGQ